MWADPEDGPLVPDVAVLGLGNVLVGDDAFGPYVVRTLAARYAAPDGVLFADLGTPGLDLTPHIAGVRALIVVDTVKADVPPGTIRCYRMHDLVARGPSPRTNPHQPTLADALLLLELQELAPGEVLLIGAVPLRYDTGAPLSEPLREAAEQAITLVLEELERQGRPARVRGAAEPPDIWWEWQSPVLATAAAPGTPTVNARCT
jgi:hydrogenase maturation protease